LVHAYCRAEEAAEAVADQPERAFIMARRDLSDLKVKEGAPLTITVEVYNAGNRYVSVESAVAVDCSCSAVDESHTRYVSAGKPLTSRFPILNGLSSYSGLKGRYLVPLTLFLLERPRASHTSSLPKFL
jgi:hypothetical protein